jgi:hypothetical protein
MQPCAGLTREKGDRDQGSMGRLTSRQRTTTKEKKQEKQRKKKGLQRMLVEKDDEQC